MASHKEHVTPLFTVVTRTCRRPSGLENAMKSVKAQTCKDWEQLLLVDETGQHRGGNILWANQQFDRHKDKIDGRYVLALDDDGVYRYPDFLERVKNCIIANDMPECILVRSISPNRGGTYVKLPAEPVWRIDWEGGQRPGFWVGHGYNWCVRSDVFGAFVTAYNKPNGGDWHFVTALILGGVEFVRCNAIGGMSMGRGYGMKFEQPSSGSSWLDSIIKRFGLVIHGGAPRMFGGAVCA